MATAKQINLRVKYAKMTVASLTKKVAITKARVKKLEAEMKKAKAAAQKSKVKKKPAARRR
jgi:hypothetical protein